MSQPHVPPSRPEGQSPSIRRAVRTRGAAHPVRRSAVSAFAPSFTVRGAPQQQASAETYSPFKIDRPPTRAEIAAWHDRFLADAAADVASGKATHPMHTHHAEVAADRVGSDWHALLDRVEAEGIDDEAANSMAAHILVNAMTGLERENVATMEVPAPTPSPDELEARYRVERERERATAVDALDAAVEATASTALADGAERDANEVNRDLVAAGIEYETARMNAQAAGKDQAAWNKSKNAALTELLEHFVESGQASLSLIMPGSGENRVLTPYGKVWPKLRALTDPASGQPVLDEQDQPVVASTAQRVAAIRAAGLADELLVEKIDVTALNALFETYVTDADIPDAMREVYELATEWKMSSASGARGRRRNPTAAEVAQGRRAGTGT